MAEYGIKTEEYSRSVQERFSKDGRVFLVDYSKHCAAQALQSLVAGGGFSSFLLVVKSAAVAADFQKILKPSLDDLHIVASYSDWLDVMGRDVELHVENLRAKAEGIRKRYPHLILVANEKSGETLFNKKLCVNTLKDGSFGNTNVYSNYCVSDMLADSAYEFIAVDDIYAMFSLKEGGRDEAKLYSPGKHDRLDFLGYGYYSEQEHSYKRLKNLLTSASKRMAIADVVVADNVATLYAAMDCVYSEFSLVKERNTFTSGRYSAETDFERLHTEIAYCRDDGDLIGAWEDSLRNKAGWHPMDNRGLENYFTANLDFTSQAEMALRVASAMSKLYYGGQFPGVEGITEQLAETEAASRCLEKTFFADEIKAALEDAVHHEARLEKLGAEELAEVFKVFLEYGVYHYFSGKDKETKVLRILRDNSGFEHFVRRHSKGRIEDEHTYSVLHAGSDRMYKCIEFTRLYDGRDGAFGIKLPALVVVNNKVAETQKMLADLLKGVKVEGSIGALAGGNEGEKLVAVATYEELRDCAVALQVSSAVFLDVSPDPVRLKLLANKLLAYGAKGLFVLASYGDLSAHIMDAWQNTLFSTARALPYSNETIEIKEGLAVDYAMVNTRVEEVYSLLQTAVMNGRPHHVEEMPNLFNKMLVDYTLKSSFTPKLIKMEVEYLARLGGVFERVFENTSSVGDVGEETLAKIRKYVAVKGNDKQKNAPQVKEEVTEESGQCTYYNACMKMLRGTCDLKKNNCADCADYKRFKTNDVETLKASVGQFFEESLAYDDQLEEARRLMKMEIMIAGSGMEDEDDGLEAASIKESREKAFEALDAIEAEGEGYPKVFTADAEHAKIIRAGVYSTYRNLLYKYYKEIRDVFKVATEKALGGYEKTKQCAEKINSGR